MPACRIYTHICLLNSCVYVTLQKRQAGHLPDIQLHWHRGEKTEYCCKHNHCFAQWQDKGKMDQYLFLGLQQLLVGTGSYKTRIRITFHQFVNVLLERKGGAVTPIEEDTCKMGSSHMFWLWNVHQLALLWIGSIAGQQVSGLKLRLNCFLFLKPKSQPFFMHNYTIQLSLTHRPNFPVQNYFLKIDN